MYNVDGLLRAIDTVMASAQNRLTQDELELLVLIRTGIAENQSMKMAEDHVWWLFNLIIGIHEYIEKMT